MTDREASKQEAPKRHFARSPEYRSVYSNGARMRVTPWDLAIIFTKTIEQDGLSKNEELLEIICSPAHMKALARALTNAVAAFEERFGAINPSIQVSIDDLRQLVQGIRIGQESG